VQLSCVASSQPLARLAGASDEVLVEAEIGCVASGGAGVVGDNGGCNEQPPPERVNDTPIP
jgi:hypothetical protein